MSNASPPIPPARAPGQRINELLEAFGDDPFTAEDYRRERTALLERFAALGMTLEDVERTVRSHDYEHGTDFGDLCDGWLENEAWEPFVNAPDPKPG